MATIANSMKESLTVQEIKNLFEKGVRIHECNRGVCLVSAKKEKDSDRYWANLSDVVGEVSLSSMPKDHGPKWAKWGEDRDRIENPVNEKLYGIKPITKFYAY